MLSPSNDHYYLCEIEDILGIDEETLLEILRELKKDNIITGDHYFKTGCLNTEFARTALNQWTMRIVRLKKLLMARFSINTFIYTITV